MHSDAVQRVYIGYDSREHDAFEVCKHTLLKHATVPLLVERVDQRALRHAGLYRRAPLPGTWTDSVDGKSFSTEFSFTRFLVPALCQYEGWALFMDCDFLWRRDVRHLFDLIEENQNKSALVVHHNYDPKDTIKMDGREQTVYSNKNWSSLMLLNCAACWELTPDVVNTKPGIWLHTFRWAGMTYKLGALDETWNWLPGHSSEGINPAAVHFTRGIPSMPGYENEPYADEWFAALKEARAR